MAAPLQPAERSALYKLAARAVKRGDLAAVDAVNERLEAARLQLEYHAHKLYVRGIKEVGTDDPDSD